MNNYHEWKNSTDDTPNYKERAVRLTMKLKSVAHRRKLTTVNYFNAQTRFNQIVPGLETHLISNFENKKVLVAIPDVFVSVMKSYVSVLMFNILQNYTPELIQFAERLLNHSLKEISLEIFSAGKEEVIFGLSARTASQIYFSNVLTLNLAYREDLFTETQLKLQLQHDVAQQLPSGLLIDVLKDITFALPRVGMPPLMLMAYSTPMLQGYFPVTGHRDQGMEELFIVENRTSRALENTDLKNQLIRSMELVQHHLPTDKWFTPNLSLGDVLYNPKTEEFRFITLRLQESQALSSGDFEDVYSLFAQSYLYQFLAEKIRR